MATPIAEPYFGFNSTQAVTLAALFAKNPAIVASTTRVAKLAAWATAFATKLNADAVENNAKAAFPLTIDTNYNTTPLA